MEKFLYLYIIEYNNKLDIYIIEYNNKLDIEVKIEIKIFIK